MIVLFHPRLMRDPLAMSPLRPLASGFFIFALYTPNYPNHSV
jgi:hypothetical protein